MLHYLKIAQNCVEQPTSIACISHRPARLSIRGSPLLWLQYGSSKQKQCREQTAQCEQASLKNTIHGVGRNNRPSLVKTVTVPNFVNRQCLHSSIVAPFTINKSGNCAHSRLYSGASLIQAPLAPPEKCRLAMFVILNHKKLGFGQVLTVSLIQGSNVLYVLPAYTCLLHLRSWCH